LYHITGNFIPSLYRTVFLAAFLLFDPLLTAAHCSLLATASIVVPAAFFYKKRRKLEGEKYINGTAIIFFFLYFHQPEQRIISRFGSKAESSKQGRIFELLCIAVRYDVRH
jgi:hypothetical protein